MKSTNNIENSFRDKFDSNSIQNEGWNNPRNIVWQKIEADLFEKKKKRFGLLPFLLLGFLMTTLIFTFYLYSQNVELKNAIQEASIIGAEDVNSLDSQTTSLQASTQVVDLEGSNVIQNTLKKENKISEIVNQNILTVQYSSDKSQTPILTKKKEMTNSILAVERKDDDINDKQDLEVLNNHILKNAIDNNSILNESRQVRSKEVEDLFLLPQISLQLGFDREISIPKIINIKKAEEARSPYLSFLPNIAVGLLQTKGAQESSLTELIDKEYGNRGLGFDFLYTIPVRRSLDFSIGLGVESISFATEYDITLPYMTEDETINGDEGFIDFEHNLPTAFGNTETALRLNRKRASEVLNEPNVNLDFDTQHSFVSLSIPLGLKYRFGGEKSYFTTGMITRPTYILNAKSGIKSVISHHSGIDAVNNESISTYANVRKFNVSLGFEIGYHLFLTEKSGLNINVGLHDYLFDFYQVDDFSSSVKKASVAIGYIYSF